MKVGGAVVDTYIAPLGFRTATFNASTGFSLNGQNMKMRGVNMHHDLGALGTAVNYRAIERQVEILKGMGVNAIRTSHNPPAPEFLDVTDRLGILVLDEAFDTWTQTKTTNDYGMYFTTWAQRDIQDMVRRDRNHPSVILWSIGNEVGGSTTATATNLRNWVRAMDTHAPGDLGVQQDGRPARQRRRRPQRRQAAGRRRATTTRPTPATTTPTTPPTPPGSMLGTETTAAVRSRGIYHTPAGTLTKATSMSMADRQCSSYDNEAAGFGDSAQNSVHLRRARARSSPVRSSGRGSTTSASRRRTRRGRPRARTTAPSTRPGFPKDVYYFYKSRWTTAPMVHILPHWNWSAGTTVTVYVYNNCDSVELFLNNTSQGSKTMSATTLRLEWSVAWASGTLRADCKVGGSVVATDQMRTAGAAARVALSADRTTIDADGKDLVFVTGDIQDANGAIVPSAENSVTLLRLRDRASWSASTTATRSTRRLTRAPAARRSAARCWRSSVDRHGRERITVTASSSGLTSGSATVAAQ